MYNSKYCKEDILTLKYGMSLREFMAHKENVKILEFMDAAHNVDESKYMKSLGSK